MQGATQARDTLSDWLPPLTNNNPILGGTEIGE
jgi:hypothetical protein